LNKTTSIDKLSPLFFQAAPNHLAIAAIVRTQEFMKSIELLHFGQEQSLKRKPQRCNKIANFLDGCFLREGIDKARIMVEFALLSEHLVSNAVTYFPNVPHK
jgi:hypothetical protein